MDKTYFESTRKKTIVVFILLVHFWGVFKVATGAKLKFDFTNSRFGPYYFTTGSVNRCNLPGPIDTENECSQNVSVYKVSRMKEEFRGVIIIPRDLPRISATVTADMWNDGGFKPFYKTEFNNACEEGIAGVLIKRYFNIGKNCVIIKGTYNLKGFEPYAMLKDLIGENFFYARVSIILSWSTKKGFVNCIRLDCDSKPIPKNLRSGINQNKTRH